MRFFLFAVTAEEVKKKFSYGIDPGNKHDCRAKLDLKNFQRH